MTTPTTATRDQAALDALVASETQRQRRGHRFYPDAKTWARMPRVDDAGVIGGQALVLAHYFGGPLDLWLTGLDDHGAMRGYIRVGDSAQWGLTLAQELEALNSHHGLIIIERDLFWTPVPACQVPDIVESGGAF